MTLNRNQFFLFLFVLIVICFSLNKVIWLATTSETTGIVSFTGHGNLGAALGITSYPVVRIISGSDTIYFNGNADVALNEGDTVSVLYQDTNPSDAKINSFITLWGDNLAYALGPLLVFIALMLMPDIFPKNSLIRFSRRPFCSFIRSR